MKFTPQSCQYTPQSCCQVHGKYYNATLDEISIPVTWLSLIRWVHFNFLHQVLFLLSRFSHYTLQHLHGKQPQVLSAQISICILKINCITSTISNTTRWKTPHYTTNDCWQWIWSPLQCTLRCCCLLTRWQTAAWEIRIKRKGKVHPKTGHKCPEVE